MVNTIKDTLLELLRDAKAELKLVERERDEARGLEAMYQKVVAACLRCDPIPACQREDGQLEPPWEVIDRIRCERDEARKEIENIKKLLLDPNAVRINMLHGQIAKLDWEKLEHIHGNHPAREQLAAERALADRLVKVVEHSAKIIGPPDSEHDSRWVTDDELDDLWNRTQSALAAWKEARND